MTVRKMVKILGKSKTTFLNITDQLAQIPYEELTWDEKQYMDAYSMYWNGKEWRSKSPTFKWAARWWYQMEFPQEEYKSLYSIGGTKVQRRLIVEILK